MNKKIILIGVLSILLGILGTKVIMSKANYSDAEQIQKGIAENIIRFHVLANSDSKEDQELKIEVKNHILDYMKVVLKDSDSIEETRETILENLNNIEDYGIKYMEELGYHYNVTANLTNTYFPVKTYGECTFPAGEYEALRIEIGKGEGKNWWCVMYPNLCFIDATHAVIPEEEMEQLKNLLTEEEYETITGNAEIRIKFKYLTFLN